MKLVGTTGFEPVTTTPPVWCATRLRYAPKRVEVERLRLGLQRLDNLFQLFDQSLYFAGAYL